MNTHTSELLDDVETLVRKYVVLSREQLTAITLWVLHAWIIEAFTTTPYLAISSAEKQSGKTVLLETLELIVPRAWLTGSVTAATLARKIAQDKPTLLLDESDAAFGGDKDYAETLRGVLNTGFRARGSYSRCVGASGTSLKVEDFSTFCAKAIAGIGTLPDTVVDRSIPIVLKRKAPNEHVERRREREIEAEAEPVRDRLTAWAQQYGDDIADVDLAPLEELPDRAWDIWEPLLQIARLAGEKWFVRAQQASLALSSRQAASDESASVQLLADIRRIFAVRDTDRITSTDLVADLLEIEESPWAEWRRPFSKNTLAKMLRRFDIRPHTIRFGTATAKGYELHTLLDAWTRYLPPVEPSQASQPSHPASHAAWDVTAVTDVTTSQEHEEPCEATA